VTAPSAPKDPQEPNEPQEPQDRPHIVVITRWREHYAQYERYLDHDAHTVTYVAAEIAVDSVPPQAAEVAPVRRTDDLEEVRAAVHALVGRHGLPAGIVALKEDDLLVAAQLRADWGCAGELPEDLLRFRDKYLMASAIAEAGLPVPEFAPAPDADAVAAFAGRHGWPVVLKPRTGSSSAGVTMLDGPEQLASTAASLVSSEVPSAAWPEPMLVQKCNPHPIYHVDGVFTGDTLATWRASRYVNSCLGFRDGLFLGSVEEDDPELLALIGTFTRRYLAALTARPTPFHLEMFVDRAGMRCEFLEVGARVGGAEIPFIWRELHGYDLMEAAFRIQLGEPVPQAAADVPRRTPEQRHSPGPEDSPERGGWLLIPAPAEKPCRITEVTPMTGREPGPYSESLLSVGEVLPAADAYYEHVGGRFRFRGRDSGEVEKALVATAEAFRVTAEPVTDSTYDSGNTPAASGS
jgi:biotin carboxylase